MHVFLCLSRPCYSTVNLPYISVYRIYLVLLHDYIDGSQKEWIFPFRSQLLILANQYLNCTFAGPVDRKGEEVRLLL